MPRSTTNFDTVRKIGLGLPGVEESTAYGSPALKVHGKLWARFFKGTKHGLLPVWFLRHGRSPLFAGIIRRRRFSFNYVTLT
jgi:hypothetical protein